MTTDSISCSHRLAVDGLAKAYRKRSVVKNVSLNLSSGEIVGLLGPNGAGKTTCFYMIVGLVRLDQGAIQLNDTDISRLSMHQRARLGIGYLPQEACVFRTLSVHDNIMGVLQLRKELSKTQRQQMLDALLHDFQIEHLQQSPGQALSGGERRRVEIARAVAMEPKFILLDEPFAGVDPISVRDIQGIIEHLAGRGIGVLITDHNVRETLGICERAYVMGEGVVLAQGSPTQILEHDKVREIYLGEEFSL